MSTSIRRTLFFLLLVSCLAACSQDTPVAPPAVEPLTAVEPAAAPPGGEGEITSFFETFDTGANVGHWTFYTPSGGVIEDEGGNPGAYLYDGTLVSFNPHPGTTANTESVFTGDWNARRVTSVGIDLRSFDYLYDVTNRYVSVVLWSDAGTPNEFGDDWGAYCVGPDLFPSKWLEMKSAPGWESYDFEIDSQRKGLPRGWKMLRPLAGEWERSRQTWSELMKDVDRVQFHWGDPSTVYFLNEWSVGLDNPRISWVE